MTNASIAILLIVFVAAAIVFYGLKSQERQHHGKHK